jgi:hypothetical protein
MSAQRTNANTGMTGAASVTKSVNTVIGKEWYFWTNSGGSFMGPGMTNPILTTSVGDWSKFGIVSAGPANYDPNTDGDIAKVAIEHTSKNGKKTYISCRGKSPLTNSCLAEYRKAIGEFEIFTMSYCAVDNSFIFQAHNKYFLHFNETFHTAAFKTCSDRAGGFPVKGRWDLLGIDETNRIGTKSAASQIPAKILLVPFKAVGALFKAVRYI